MDDLQGRVCLVTGGGRGIGRAVVAAMARRGARVHAVDLAGPPAEALPDGVAFHACDVTDRASVGRLAAALAAAEGKLDVLVNNAAAVTRATPLVDLTDAEWDMTMAVNVTGVFNVTRALLPLMGRGGSIVNLASTFAHVGSANRTAYATTKGAVLAFTRSLALELAEAGIRVNSVSPGAIATERMVVQFGSEDAASRHMAPLHPIGRLGRPEEIAEALCFLASARASFMTGSDMVVDGGYIAR